jgi:hypothetical protein
MIKETRRFPKILTLALDRFGDVETQYVRGIRGGGRGGGTAWADIPICAATFCNY